MCPATSALSRSTWRRNRRVSAHGSLTGSLTNLSTWHLKVGLELSSSPLRGESGVALLRYADALLAQELLECGEPMLVIRGERRGRRARLCSSFRSRDLGDQSVTKLLPLVESSLTQGDGQGKDASFPRIVKDQFSAFPGQGGYSIHVGDVVIDDTGHCRSALEKGVRSQKSGVRSQKSGVRSQKLGVRNFSFHSSFWMLAPGF